MKSNKKMKDDYSYYDQEYDKYNKLGKVIFDYINENLLPEKKGLSANFEDEINLKITTSKAVKYIHQLIESLNTPKEANK